jgi:prolyl-tRNA synthetase
MRLSRYLLPTMKETPAEAQIVSHRLMLRAGMIRQTSAGIYAWLPLGLRVLKRIEAIVREEQDRFGCQELLMPTIQSADLWRESGRYEDYGKEMLRIRDRHDRDLLYGPTNEEMITDLFRQSVRSYRDLPKLLYHIQWKFRDEIRPRFGVMRGREFLMKDAYSFDVDFAAAKASYDKFFVCYLSTFARLGLKAVPVKAETGPIGGDLSHEFHILAETGESELFVDPALLSLDMEATARRRCRWAPTASASPAWPGRSSRPATTRQASSGPTASHPLRPASSTSSPAMPRATGPPTRSTRRCAPAGSRPCSTTATSGQGPSSPTWT